MSSQDHDGLLGALPISDRAKSDLVAWMQGPRRHYHCMDHLVLLWARHRRFARAAQTDLSSFETRIALAIAFHDAVYVGGAIDNEERSASAWLDLSVRETEIGETDRQWVAETILATADHLSAAENLDLSNPSHHARQWVLDLDLTPLGEAPDVFDANMALLLAEDPKANLAAGIRRFAAADPLYKCAPLASSFQQAARANFARHLGHDAE